MGRVTVVRAALDDTKEFPVLRGVILCDSLTELQTDIYQRDVQPNATIAGIMKGYREGVVPDIFLSVRGMELVRDTASGVFHIDLPTFIVDGLQRTSAAIRLFQQGQHQPVVGAEIHFGRDRAWEREMFKTLNVDRTRLNSNIIIRNEEEKSAAAAALLALSRHHDFPMRDKICWEQSMKKGELITAVTLLKVAGILHSRFGATLGSEPLAILAGLDRIISPENPVGVSERAFKRNVQTYFTILRDVWGISNISMKDTCLHLKWGFLKTLATFLVRIDQFWDVPKGQNGQKGQFRVETSVLQKMKQFPITDPTIKELCGSSGKGEKLLYSLFLDHMNKGRRTNRFVDKVLLAEMGAGGDAGFAQTEEGQQELADAAASN